MLHSERLAVSCLKLPALHTLSYTHAHTQASTSLLSALVPACSRPSASHDSSYSVVCLLGLVLACSSLAHVWLQPLQVSMSEDLEG